MTTNRIVIVEGVSDLAYLNALDRRIENVSGQRRLFLTAAHELAHHVLSRANDTAMSGVLDAIGLVVLQPKHSVPFSGAPVFGADGTLTAVVVPTALDDAPSHVPLWNTRKFAGLPSHAWPETSHPGASDGLRISFRLSRGAGSTPAEVQAAVLRLVNVLLAMASLRFLQLLSLDRERCIVLARLGRPPGTVAFALAILAVCRRYGHRSEPGDHAALFTRHKLVSMGSYTLAC